MAVPLWARQKPMQGVMQGPRGHIKTPASYGAAAGRRRRRRTNEEVEEHTGDLRCKVPFATTGENVNCSAVTLAALTALPSAFLHTRTCVDIQTHTHTRTHARTHAHAHARTRTHARTHAHTHTHTHTHARTHARTHGRTHQTTTTKKSQVQG